MKNQILGASASASATHGRVDIELRGSRDIGLGMDVVAELPSLPRLDDLFLCCIRCLVVRVCWESRRGGGFDGGILRQ